MPIPVVLALTAAQHKYLRDYLFCDGRESVAFLICGMRDGDRKKRLCVREVFLLPNDAYSERTAVKVKWSPDFIDDILEKASEEKLSVIKIHSHPNGYSDFSITDDQADRELLPLIKKWVEAEVPHGSAIMMPDGQIFGRILDADENFVSIDCVSVAGDDLHFWYSDGGDIDTPDFMASHAQIFDEGTIERLQRLSVAVIGASGTGSPTIEQLKRLGVGEIIIVDDDVIEERNVNRILNSSIADAQSSKAKTQVQKDAAESHGLDTNIIQISNNLWEQEAIEAVAQCDIVFGCMDTVDGRFILNAISTYYNIPYFDIGVRLVASSREGEEGHIREVCGTINYIQSGMSSLMSRGLFSMKDVAAAGLRRNDKAAHEQQVNDGYITGVEASRPAVISVNMFASSLAVNEFLARLHPFREEDNFEYAAVIFSLSSMEFFYDVEEGECNILNTKIGYGDVKPCLGLMELAERL